MKPTPFIILAAMLALLSGCATHQDVLSLDNRLADLEKQYTGIKDLEQESKTKTRKLRSKSASLGVKMRRLEGDIRALRGTLEEIEFQIRKLKKYSEKSNQLLISRLDRIDNQARVNREHIDNLEKYLDFNPDDLKTAAELKGTPEKNATKDMDEEALYQSARLAFEKGSFDSAREQFQELIRRFPKSKDADNAQFWIGEIYYRNKLYKEAIVEYQRVIENYPSGNKVKASMLKQGYAFFHLGNKKLARKLFKELIKKYPGSSQAKFAKKKLKSF